MLKKNSMFRMDFVVIFTLLILSNGAGSALAASLEKMIAERSALVWVEGQVLGDMVIGARAQLDFTYADSKLVKVVFDDVPAAPEWIVWNLQHAGKKTLKGKALFVVRFKALIPWDFDPEKILVGSYRVRSTDILTDKAELVQGTLPSGFAGDLVFAVPTSEVSPETVVGYENFTAKITTSGR